MESLPHCLHTEICKYLTLNENTQLHHINTKFRHKMCSTLQQLYLEEYQSSLSDIIAKTEEELSKSKPMLVTALQVVSALGIQDLKDVGRFRTWRHVFKIVLDVV
mmetsp:Transcript_63570/g.72858  ORF Transcript_63570/g.72858 Transcript_63570/m.72858 type:complete len:105 (+) Transcript_63570:65-379(+)